MHEQFDEYLSQFVTDHKLSLFERIIATRTRHLTVALEDILVTHNASACLRSCDCFGIQDVHIVENENRFQLNRDVTLGAAQWLTLSRYRQQKHNTLACINALKDRGYRIVVTSPQSGCRLEDYDVSRKTALWFGNEHLGLSQIAFDHADEHLHVPMFGFTKSFNISVAVAVCLHHLVWKLHNSEIDWRLHEQEVRDIKSTWVKKVVRKKLSRDEEFWFRQAGLSCQTSRPEGEDQSD